MNANLFINVVGDFFDNWLRTVAHRISNGSLKIDEPYSFPSNLRIGETPYHFIAELLGSIHSISPIGFKLLRPKISEKFNNTSSYFTPGFAVKEGQIGTVNFPKNKYLEFNSLAFCTQYDLEIFTKKVNFPISIVKILSIVSDVPLVIKPPVNFLVFRQIDLIRTDVFRVFFRTISTALVIKKTTMKHELINWLELMSLNQSGNIHIVGEDRIDKTNILGLNIGFDASSDAFARQLASLSDQDVSEPIIDKFIQAHSNEFAFALGYKDAWSQIELEWIDKATENDNNIKPDYLLKRDDGFFDILDLKRALLKYQSITVGKRSRIRFNNYVNELIAQLANYERYFDNIANSEWANQKYGIKVKHPRLYGIVGNYDSYKKEDVDLALYPYKENIAILSYHDVINLLRRQSNP